MTDRSGVIENLRLQLARLEIATTNIRKAIRDLENDDESYPVQSRPSATTHNTEIYLTADRDGNHIHIGSRIRFLTKGKYKSTTGTVTKFSKNYERIFAEDIDGSVIPRAPHNVRIIYDV